MKERTLRSKLGPILAVLAAAIAVLTRPSDACTFITLQGKDGTVVVGRTMEWAAFDLQPRLTIIPRGAALTASEMSDGKDGASWTAKYGAVAIGLLGKAVYADAVNEVGLTASLLYLPGFAEYQAYDPARADVSLAPPDVIAWVATRFETTRQVRDALEGIRVVPVVEPVLGVPAPVHYIVTDAERNSIVVEYVGGELHVHDASLGVLTNSPTYDWHVTNLRNYRNLRAVAWSDVELADIDLAPIGAGSGMLGLPGDFTPPSRFVRAVAFTQAARATEGGFDTVRELLRILDGFNVPIAAVEAGAPPAGLEPLCCSGTQYTAAVDLENLVLYYHTDTARRVRKVELGQIDFGAIGLALIHQPLRAAEEDAVLDVTPRR